MKYIAKIIYVLMLAVLLTLATLAMWYYIRQYIVLPSVCGQLPSEIFSQNFDMDEFDKIVFKYSNRFGFGARLIFTTGDCILYFVIGFPLEIPF